MSNEFKLLPGYYIKVDSWENDLDVRRTEHIYGLTKAQAQLYYDFAMMLHRDTEHNFGNDEYIEEEHASIIRALLIKHQATLQEKWEDAELDFANENDEIIGYTFNEIMYDLVGSSESCDYYRVVESVNIYSIPFEMEFPDVTEEFSNG